MIRMFAIPAAIAALCSLALSQAQGQATNIIQNFDGFADTSALDAAISGVTPNATITLNPTNGVGGSQAVVFQGNDGASPYYTQFTLNMTPFSLSGLSAVTVQLEGSGTGSAENFKVMLIHSGTVIMTGPIITNMTKNISSNNFETYTIAFTNRSDTIDGIRFSINPGYYGQTQVTIDNVATVGPPMPQTLTNNVQPLNGTDNGCDEFPGAVVPFGMVQWSPDTTPAEPGGYLYTATQITGFSLDHLSGAGCDYGGDFAFTPILGSVTSSPATYGNNGRTAFASTFSHTNEIATPGYYSVQFTNGIRTELTATARTGFGRFTYPSGQTAAMAVNFGSDATETDDALLQVNPGGQEISGWAIVGHLCGKSLATKVYFDAVFDHAFAAYSVWNGATLTPGGTNASGPQSGVYLNFNLPSGGVVLARVAISYVSLTNAQNNLQTESPLFSFTSSGFDTAVSAASNSWNAYLNKIQVSGGTPADTATFYTMMYHALQAPSIVSDVNGQYMGFDGQTHAVAAGHSKYELFSGWDIYRNECQFIAMMDPARASDMAESLVLDAQQGGTMPRWSVPNGDTGVMVGDPATPIIAGMYAFGATNFDTASALAAMVKAAVNPATVDVNGLHERSAERDYLNLGFVPEYENGGGYGPVSMTLEYCSADCALARFAQALGDTTNYTLAMNRAQNWRNLYNTNSGYLQMRRSDGFWTPGFVNNNPTYDNYQGYVEGSAAQYTWMVPFNLASLAELMGGPQVASARLDTFFTLLTGGNASQFANMRNEPCSEAPWIYDFLGRPYKTSSVVRQIMTNLYSTATYGLPGNDDLGQMASWYVLAALGMHPEIPGDDVLVMNGPLFPEAVVHLPGGDVIITGSGAGDNAPYVQSLLVNGESYDAPWIRFADIANGGTLAFTMGTAPNTNWGSNLSLAPPSYTDGMTSPLAQNYFWGTGLETNETQITWTNTVDTGSGAGGITNVGPILASLSGPELGVRSERSQSGTYAIMYSGKALGASTNYAYMKMFDLSSQSVVVSSGMHFSYWIYPQSQTNETLVTGSNSTYVALDLIFTDGTNLRDSGLTNQYGVPVNPAKQGGKLAMDTWNYVTVDLTPLVGKTVSRIDLGYSQPGGSGGYRGYVDDIAFSIPAAGLSANDLALNQPATADSQQAGYPAANGNDGSTTTRWSANDENAGHWWQVDLGGPCNLTGDEIIWQLNGVIYDYTVAVSIDNTNWTTVVNKTANPSTAQDQTDIFMAVGRYVRITVTGLPAGDRASFEEFRAFGTMRTTPSAPTGLQAWGGCGNVTLSWAASPGATSYQVKRSTSSGTETTIADLTTTGYLDQGVTNGTTYYYVVSAENMVGQGSNCSEVEATPEAPLPGSYASAIVAGNPVAYWPLNETNGAVAFDPVGSHNGYYNQVQLGLPGSGFQFDPDHAILFGTNAVLGTLLASNSYVGEIDESGSGIANIDFSEPNGSNAEFSVEAWENGGAQETGAAIIAKGYGSGGEQFVLDFGASGNALRFFVRSSSGGVYACPSAFLPDGNWHQVVGVCDEANGNLRLYVDGVAVANAAIPVGAGLQSAIAGQNGLGDNRVSIGARTSSPLAGGYDDQFVGAISEVALYNYALSSNQVAADYLAGANLAAFPLSFGSGLGWTTNGGATLTNGILTLTDGNTYEARSFFFQSPQYIGAFKAAFTYQAGGNKEADGAAFVLQNDPRGAQALGTNGESLGVGGTKNISSSVELELNLYTGSSENMGYTVLSNGLTGGSGANGNYHAPGNVNFAGGDPINITVDYANGQMTLTFVDTATAATFHTNWAVGDLTNIVGGSTAYIGFAGADGGATSIQTITNFTFVSIPPVAIQLAGSNELISWPAAPGYRLQQNSDLTTTNWVPVINGPIVTNGNSQVILPAYGTNLFYRLFLPSAQ